MKIPESWQAYLEPELITQLAIDYGQAIVFAVVIFVVGRIVAKIAAGVMKRGMKRGGADETIIGFVGNIAYGLLMAFVVIAALNQLGVETTSLAAILAAAGLAVGLALQGSLSNFASGVLVITFRPFKVGDYVEAGGTSGTVEEVNLFTTHLKSPDNKSVIVPNGSITTNTITNYSAKPTRRIDLVFGIGYDDDMKQAKDIIAEVFDGDARILKDPAPTIAVDELGDNSVNIVARPWVATADYWAVKWDLVETIKRRFDESGISIPFPQRDVWIRDAGTGETTTAG